MQGAFMATSDPSRQLLRHTVATLAYRAGKAIRECPESFAGFSTGEKGRTPAHILAHMGDLFDWALSIAKGKQEWHDSAPLPVPAEKLFQGPVADALTHTGQLAMLRRMAGGPIRAENYARAEIIVGRVGQEQAA